MKTDDSQGYRTLFGPVPSRRLGISLGVDLVRHKTCTLDCVYCECGPTTRLTIQRNADVAVDTVKQELAAYLARERPIDHITFSGSGEPTLNEAIGEVVDYLKTEHPRYPVALLTNGTLFDRSEVRHQVNDVDVVMVSLDAATTASFRSVNRPHPQLDLPSIIDGVAAFSAVFRGRLLIEHFVVPGCNDSAEEQERLKAILKRVGADGVVINTLDRPGTEAWVRPAPPRQLKKISDFLAGAEIVKYEAKRSGPGSINADLMARLVATVRRRPCTARDVAQVIGLAEAAVQPMLDQLVDGNQLAVKRMGRGIFYIAP